MAPTANQTDVPEERLAIALVKIGLALRHQAWLAADAQGLSPTQGQILAVLKKHPAGLRLTEISAQLGVTTATSSDAVAALLFKKLVSKKRDGSDRRAVVIRLTNKGLSAAETAAQWPDFLLEGLEELTVSEQAVFLRGMTKIIRSMQIRNRIPVARMCVTCKYFRPNAHTEAAAPHHCDFIDAPLGDINLRMDCEDHVLAPAELQKVNWTNFNLER